MLRKAKFWKVSVLIGAPLFLVTIVMLCELFVCGKSMPAWRKAAQRRMPTFLTHFLKSVQTNKCPSTTAR